MADDHSNKSPPTDKAPKDPGWIDLDAYCRALTGQGTAQESEQVAEYLKGQASRLDELKRKEIERTSISPESDHINDRSDRSRT